MKSNCAPPRPLKSFEVTALFLLFVSAPLAFGILSLALGKDMNWDLRNYHYYNPYAFLAWRHNIDVAPAQLQTWFNPLLDVPWFLMMKYLSSPAVGFVTGAFQGLNFPFASLIAWRLLTCHQPTTRGLLSLTAATFGCIGPIFLMELGSTNHDTTLSVLILAAIFLLLGPVIDSSANRTKSLVAAGALLGAATALKLTNAVYALGATFALYLATATFENRFRRLMVFCTSGAVVGLVLLGPWMWFLYQQFGNPLFPQFNNVFQSPWVQPHDFAFDGFLPDAVWEYAVWPLIFSADPHRVWEWKFVDYRFALLWIVALLYLVGVVNQAPWSITSAHTRSATDNQRTARNFLFYFTTFSFLLWMFIYSAYRYLAPLEIIAPLVLALALAGMQLSRKTLVLTLALLGLLSMAVLDVPDRRRFAWDKKYIQVHVPNLADYDDSLVLMVGGGAPMAYVIPEFPSGTRFVRPDGNLGLKGDTLMMKRIASIVRSHTGPIHLLFSSAKQEDALRSALQNFGLTTSTSHCTELKSNAPDRLMLCAASVRDDN